MKRPALYVLALLVLMLSLALVGCSDSPDTEPTDAGQPADDVGAEESEAPEASTEATDFSYLTGRWTVTTELTEIDNAMMTIAADQPGATWECTVSGNTMHMVTEAGHEYDGSLSPEGDNGWVYEATATYTDEGGSTWISTIEVHAKPMSSTDAFVGGMIGSIDSDTDGHLYKATWDIEGQRQ